ncbi:unnamed protein product [Scytosiphon promiscuus]
MKQTTATCLACAVLSVAPALGFVVSPAGAVARLPWTTPAANDASSSSLSSPRHDTDRPATTTTRAGGVQARGSALRMVATPEISTTKAPGTADMDWENLGFEYRDVNSHVKFTFKNGAWNEGELVKDPYVKVHIANTALHYGQSVFEGLKAFHRKDGSVKLFRPDENAKRIRASAERILMEPPPADLFIKACKMAVKRSRLSAVAPIGRKGRDPSTHGALYLRPLLYGSAPRIGLQPSDEYTLLVMAIPVGNYYKGGFKPTTAVVIEDYDRAAPKGVGAVKVAGNYAADMMPNMMAKQAGYPIDMSRSLLAEFSTSNFFAVTQDNKFVTPKSPAVLPSITNKSLMQLAEDEGMVVEHRPVPFSEVASFKEVAACGTAVVMTTIKQIVKGGEIVSINGGSDETGPVCQSLYDRVRGVQAGELEDKFGWMLPV